MIMIVRVKEQPLALSMFTVFFLLKEELITSEGHEEMDDPWPLCPTIGPLSFLSQEIC